MENKEFTFTKKDGSTIVVETDLFEECLDDLGEDICYINSKKAWLEQVRDFLYYEYDVEEEDITYIIKTKQANDFLKFAYRYYK